MKTSLLLIGLVMGAGIAGTAQAADATECAHTASLENHTLANASSAGHGMLSEFADMLSVHLTKDSDHASSSSNADTSSQAPQDYPHQPGPTPATAPHGQRGNTTPDNTAAPMDIMHAGGNPAPAPASSDDPPTTLGWQSLLPGSIQ